MHGHLVYRVDYVSRRKEPIGGIIERRGRERGKNVLALLIEARKLFGSGPSDYIRIALGPRAESDRPGRPAQDAS